MDLVRRERTRDCSIEEVRRHFQMGAPYKYKDIIRAIDALCKPRDVPVADRKELLEYLLTRALYLSDSTYRISKIEDIDLLERFVDAKSLPNIGQSITLRVENDFNRDEQTMNSRSIARAFPKLLNYFENVKISRGGVFNQATCTLGFLYPRCFVGVTSDEPPPNCKYFATFRPQSELYDVVVSSLLYFPPVELRHVLQPLMPRTRGDVVRIICERLESSNAIDPRDTLKCMTTSYFRVKRLICPESGVRDCDLMSFVNLEGLQILRATKDLVNPIIACCNKNPKMR